MKGVLVGFIQESTCGCGWVCTPPSEYELIVLDDQDVHQQVKPRPCKKRENSVETARISVKIA